eukprot:SAG31_NODE_20219_length_580_cov_13.386694_2_plen_35_part_01
MVNALLSKNNLNNITPSLHISYILFIAQSWESKRL